MPDTLTTPRLVLRRITMDDAPAMHAIFADAEAMAVLVAVAAHRHCRNRRMGCEDHRCRRSGDAEDFVVIHDSALVGRIGIWQKNELGLIFARSVWGTGVAREAAEALIERSRARGMTAIMADIDPRNLRVRRFLEKLGFKKTGAAKNTYKIGDIWTDSEYLTLDPSGEA